MFLNGKDQYCKNEQTEHTYKLNTIPHMVLVELSRAGEPDMLAIFRRVKIWEWSIKFEKRKTLSKTGTINNENTGEMV